MKTVSAGNPKEGSKTNAKHKKKLKQEIKKRHG